MNPDAAAQISEAFAYEASLPMPLLTSLCAVVVAGLAWLFWLERRRATRPALMPVLLGLRVLAVAGVWLALANPTAVRTTRSTSPKHSALCLDTSASMGLQDAANRSGNAPRWRRASGDGAQAKAPLDLAIALLGASSVNLSQAALTLNADETRTRLTQAGTAARAALGQLEAARNLPGAGAQLAPLRTQLDTEVLRPLDRLQRTAAPSAEGRDTVRAPLHALATRLTEIREQLRPIADTIVDSPDAAAPARAPRLDFVRRWLARGEKDWLGKLGEATALARCQFATATAPIEGAWSALQAAEAADPAASTDLQTALDDLARRSTDGRLDLAVLVTDGVHNADGPPLHLPEALTSVPMLVVPIGDYEPRRDLDLRWKEAPKTILLKDEFTVQARVSASLCDGESTVIELLEGKRVLDSKPLHFQGPSADRLVELQWKPERAGTFDLTLRVRPVARETSLANNESALKVSVVDLRLDLFVADSVPRWETRYLFNLFRRETQSNVTTLLFSPLHAYPGRPAPPAPALPFALAAWQRFQVVILGDLSPQQLTVNHQQLLAKFVENGGALIVIAGAESMPAAFKGAPLADLLPVIEGGPVTAPAGFGVRLTAEGKTSEALRISGASGEDDAARWSSIFEALPIYDLSPWSLPKPSARVLIEAVPREASGGQPRVFLATQSYGRGSVTYLSSPSTYALRWRFGDRYHYQFWGQFLRALVANQFGSGTPLVRLQTDKFTYRLDEPVRARLRLRSAKGEPPAAASVQIVASQEGKEVARAAGQPDPNAPGEWVATLPSLPAGKFELRPEGEEVAALLRAARTEAPRLPIEIEAAAPSNEMVPANEPPPFFSLVKNLPNVVVLAPEAVPAALQHLDLSPGRSETTQRTPLWNRWHLLLAMVGCLALEWVGRKFAGLI